MTEADVSEFNLGVMLCKGSEWKVEVLKSVLRQKRHDKIPKIEL